MNQFYLRGVSTLKLASEKCTGCGRCVEVCPHGVFDINDRRAHIIALDNCMECGACSQNCAFGALSVKSGVGCATAMINGILTKGDPDLGTCDCSGAVSSGTCC
ncbi:MAG TPA: mercury methylation ferredoxin HgcB [Chitinivibrionales bacterium]|nr:mercury methylation ferredoxin HgcB [Chitinivibrionales bacterium]